MMARCRPCSNLLAALLVVGLSQWPGSAVVGASSEQEASTQLRELERNLREERGKGETLKRRSAALAKDLERLRRRTIERARSIRSHEAAILKLEARLAELARTERGKINRLAESRSRFAEVLAALERIARFPPEALFVQPGSPNDMVRSAILLRAAVPEIERRAARLRADVDELIRARLETAKRRRELTEAAASLEAETKELEVLVALKAKMRRAAESEGRASGGRVAALARTAKDLKDLLVRLEGERRQRREREAREQREAERRDREPSHRPAAVPASPAGPPPGFESRSFQKARGSLPYPVVGRIRQVYGEATETGLTHKGLTIEALSGAQVIATHDGQVVFAGKFRGYGQLLIIEHGEGYHTLFVGLARIDSEVGEWVLAGEPVGTMGRPKIGKPTLYVELRRDGQPINPLPWLAARKGKVSG